MFQLQVNELMELQKCKILDLPSIRPTTVILLSLRQITAKKGYVASRRARETTTQIEQII